MLAILQKDGRGNRTRHGGSGRCLPDVSPGHRSGVPRVATADSLLQTAQPLSTISLLLKRISHLGWAWPLPAHNLPSPARLPQGLSLEEGLQPCPGLPQRPWPNDSPWAQPVDQLCKLQLLPNGIAVQPQSLRARATILKCIAWPDPTDASLAQLVEHALCKRMVVGSIPTGGSLA